MAVFTNPAEYYRRDFNIVDDGLATYAKYLSLKTGKDFNYCLEWIRNNSGKDKLVNLEDPKIKILYRGDNGDRTLVTTTFNSLQQRIHDENLICVPTMTCYLPPSVKKSIISDYQEKNVEGRDADKALAFKYQRSGDLIKKDYYNNSQNCRKIKNNAVSGTHTIPNNPFYIKSAHPTLTSTCSTVTGYTNATNEKFIAGNRHYWCPDIAVSNLISVALLTDLVAVEAAMRKYNLSYPTVEQTMACVSRGSELEWYNKNQDDRIIDLISKLTDVERAAFMFVSDFYHLHIVNPNFAVDMLVRLGKMPEQGIDDPDTYISMLDGDQRILMSLICCELMKKDGRSYSISECKETNPDSYRLLGTCAKNIIESVDYYTDFYRAFYVTKNLPTSIYHIADIKRHAVPGSDTDSSIVTVQHWTKAVTGSYGFTDLDRCTAAAMSYLGTQLVNHVVATVSGNMGIPDQYKFTIQMKNEFLFPVFSLTGRAKHYYAYQMAKEGNILPDLVTEIKGVHLRSSRLPTDIKQHLKVFIESVMTSALSGKREDVNRIFNEVMYLENKIDQSVADGSVQYMMRERINDKYSKEAGSKLIHWHLWRDVFAKKYGETPPPPYRGVKVKMNLPKAKDIEAWITTIQDPYIRTKIREWVERTGKADIGNFILPDGVVRRSGIPVELRNAVDTRLLKQELLSGFYLVLQSLGLFITGDKIDSIIGDFHKHYDPNYRMTDLV